MYCLNNVETGAIQAGQLSLALSWQCHSSKGDALHSHYLVHTSIVDTLHILSINYEYFVQFP